MSDKTATPSQYEHEWVSGIINERNRYHDALTYYAEGRYPDGGERAREALGWVNGRPPIYEEDE